ncbi:unnamed protein product [Leuciscus chuanchicus]
MDNFSSLPGALKDLLNGHVVFLYLCSYESNRAKTVKFLSSFEEQGPVRLLEAAIIKVVRNLEKFQRLSRPIVFEKLDSICREKFSFLMEQSETKQLSHASEMEPEPPPTPAKVSVISPVKNTRRTSKFKSYSIAIKTRSALKECEDTLALKKLWGNDCSAGNIVMAMNKLRYKDGKGDPRGFVTFLDNQKMPRGILPRYRGNRLHILFHICGVFIQHYTVFIKFLEKGTSCGGLRASLFYDFRSTTGHVQMQVLGLLGKLLTGPWMKKFYRAAVNQIDHVEAISVVKEVVTRLKEQRSPLDLLTQSNDFFGDALKDSDATLQKLRDPPKDEDLFKVVMEACLGAIVEVLERQYKKYFEIDLTKKLKEETKSARTHNIDAEEIMGMFSASKKRSPNATLCFLSCKMRAQKNKTVGFLDDMDTEKRDAILKKAVKPGQVQRQRRRVKQNDLREELSKRQAMKEQAKEITARNKLERKLKNIQIKDLEEKFPELEKSKLEKIT